MKNKTLIIPIIVISIGILSFLYIFVVSMILHKMGKITSRINPERAITLYLTNGSAISGELLDKTGNAYVILWQGGEVSFSLDEVERAEKGTVIAEKEGRLFEAEEPEKWPYKHDLVVRTTKGTIIDGAVTGVSKEAVTVGYDVEGGGRVEQELSRADIEYMMSRPVENQESAAIRRRLERLFPSMQFYDEGGITIATDSYVTWVKEYKATLRQAYTDMYLEFFEIFKGSPSRRQHFVVIFDDYRDFADYAVSDGVPAWAVLGYFNPDEGVLYLFNSMGDRFSDYAFRTIVGSNVKAVDDYAGRLKDRYRGEHELAIDGMADEIKDRFWKYYNAIKGDFREQTMSTLRHEFAHEVFSNMGLQNIVVSRAGGGKGELTEKRKEYLDTEDPARRRDILMDLLTLRSRLLSPELLAANSWLAEGIATFCETDPPGSQNNTWLYIFQQMKREGTVYPLEYLTVYKIGSFPGVYKDAMRCAYAESWAFVKFLMDVYPGQFLRFQERLARERTRGQDDITWLLDQTGKGLKELEKEFIEYTDRYEELDDPLVKRHERMLDIFNEFRM